LWFYYSKLANITPQQYMTSTPLKKFLYGLWEIFEVVFISLITVLFIRAFLFQPFLVSGASMEPSYSDGDYLVIDQISYRFGGDPERGHTIVFRFPGDASIFFIKRIVGLPGERVVGKNGLVTVYTSEDNKLILEEPYLAPNTKTPGSFDVQLGDDEFFVLGDNRSHSFDSRSWGPVKREYIIGVTRLKIFPLSHIQFSETPHY